MIEKESRRSAERDARPTEAEPRPKPRVTLRVVTVDTERGRSERLAVQVDGDLIGVGEYGGEDNTRSRTYGWVEDLLEKLARRLGADVVTLRSKPEDT
jgi:hypothetical protein